MNFSNRPKDKNTTLFQNGNIDSAVLKESLSLTITIPVAEEANRQTFSTLTTSMSMVQHDMPTNPSKQRRNKHREIAAANEIKMVELSKHSTRH
jgi:hypothetical protein